MITAFDKIRAFAGNFHVKFRAYQSFSEVALNNQSFIKRLSVIRRVDSHQRSLSFFFRKENVIKNVKFLCKKYSSSEKSGLNIKFNEKYQKRSQILRERSTGYEKNF